MNMSRRNFLCGSAGAVLALPAFLSSTARASSAAAPRRFITLYRPNGTIPDAWFPTAGANESDFSLGPIHQPLQSLKDQLVFLRGVHMDVCAIGPGEQHQQGMGALLTGREILAGDFVGGDGSRAGWANGRSIDQRIADEICPNHALRSLELGVRTLGNGVRHRLVYQGPANPIAPENDPSVVFARLFPGGEVSGIESNRRRSVLDAVRAQYGALQRRVSHRDAIRLEEHADLLRAMEQRLAARASLNCSTPEAPTPLDPLDESELAGLTRLQMDLLLLALRCDHTRVGTFQFSSGENAMRFPFLNSYEEDHRLSHSSHGERRAEWVARQTWYMEQVAYFLEQLRQTPEGDGTMLDNSLVFIASEISVGQTHSHKDMPYILAGGAGGALDTGRYVQYGTGRQHNDLLATFLAAFGIDEASYGHPDFCSGDVLPGLLS